MLDVSDFSERDVWDDYQIINRELNNYDATLSDLADFVPLAEREHIVVFNKIDAVTEDRLEKYKKVFHEEGIEVIELSAVANINKDHVIRAICNVLYGDNNE